MDQVPGRMYQVRKNFRTCNLVLCTRYRTRYRYMSSGWSKVFHYHIPVQLPGTGCHEIAKFSSKATDDSQSVSSGNTRIYWKIRSDQGRTGQNFLGASARERLSTGTEHCIFFTLTHFVFLQQPQAPSWNGNHLKYPDINEPRTTMCMSERNDIAQGSWQWGMECRVTVHTNMHYLNGVTCLCFNMP